MIASSPWVARLELTLTDKELGEQIRVPVAPEASLALLAAPLALLRLEKAFKAMVVPTAQMIAAIRRLVDVALAYSQLAYPDARTFLEGVYSNEIKESAIFPICLTGLSGVGKSVILAAFQRLFSGTATVEVPGHSNFTVTSCWYIHIHSSAGLATLLTPLFRQSPYEMKGALRSTLGFAVFEAASQGVPLVLADEFQFLTQSSSANVSISKLIMQLTRIGPPVVVACNYSLVHRLQGRPQEERDRLLVRPLVIHPDSASSEDWKNLVAESLRVSPEFISLDIESVADILHRYTFGLKRALASLLCLSYDQMRRRNETHVELMDIKAAYLSMEYSTFRGDVEALKAHALGSEKIRLDLRCPFEGPGAEPPTTPNVVSHPAAIEHAQRLAEAAVRSSLSPEEREGLECASAHLEPSSRSTRAPRPARPPVTSATMLGGAAVFAKANKRSKKKPTP